MKIITIPALVLTFVITACGGGEAHQIENAVVDAIEDVYVNDEVRLIGGDLFESTDGKFKINFNGEPTVSSDMVPTDVGNIEMTSFLYEKSVTEAYMVAYNDYPSEMVEASSVADMLDGAKNGSASSMNITIFDLEENIEVEGNPGRHFKGNNGSYYVEYKLFLKGNRLYQIAIIRDGSYATPERTEDFFGSFELVE